MIKINEFKTMKKILNGVFETISNVLYLLLLMGMFIVIYMLLGIALMSDDPNFKSLLGAFYLVFDIITVENWNLYLFNLY